MQFILKLKRDKPNVNEITIKVNAQIQSADTLGNYLSIRYLKEKDFLRFSSDQYEAFVLGDLIIPKDQNRQIFLAQLLKDFTEEKMKTLKGHFYFILIDRISNTLMCFNSMFSILPVYIQETNVYIIVSSSIRIIKDFTRSELKINNKFLLQKLLFNYAFLNDNIYEEIKSLPSNHFIRIGDIVQIIKHTNISDYFTDEPDSWKRAIDPVSDLFLYNLDNYFPENHFYLTFTGGFDGRTLVASVISNKLNFTTFSYGSINDKDIQVPLNIAKGMNLKHVAFVLDDKYAQESYIPSLENLLLITDCTASISRSHYAYIANILGAKTDYFLSGNFGSEIIRTMRMPGVMTSGLLLKIFDLDDDNLLYKELNNSANLKFFKKDKIQNELDQLFEEIKEYKNNQDKSLNKNQRFYIYLFEEVLRKYFGAEFIIQNNYGLTNRTPFLDLDFIILLLKTELAGVNGRYLESNPFLRFRGQILYSYILKKLNSPLSDYPTDRGYRPKDFFSLSGKINIVSNYINNNFINKHDKNYTHYNHISFNSNRDYFSSLDILPEIIEKNDLSTASLNDNLSNLLSILVYLNKFHN